MILYRSTATYGHIMGLIRHRFRLQVIDTKPEPVERQVMHAVGYCAQIRVKSACEPVFQSLSHLEKMYASLNYHHPRPRRHVVHTNMGMLFSDPDTGDK